jgi:hypothetical protein
MNTEDILKAIDEQIGRLQQARQLLVGSAAPAGVSVRRGRPKGSKNKGAVAPASTPPKAAERVMSAEAKARIAAAQKLRWEKQKAGDTTATSAAKTPVSARAKKAVAKPKAAKKTAAKTSATADA